MALTKNKQENVWSAASQVSITIKNKTTTINLGLQLLVAALSNSQKD